MHKLLNLSLTLLDTLKYKFDFPTPQKKKFDFPLFSTQKSLIFLYLVLIYERHRQI